MKIFRKNPGRKLITAVFVIIGSFLILGILYFLVLPRTNLLKSNKESKSLPNVSWSKFADGYFGLSVSYPESWQVVRTPDGKLIKFYSPDKKQVLTIALGKTETEAEASRLGNFLEEKSGRDGKVSILGQELERELVVMVGKTVEIYWARKSAKITDDKYFSATLSSVATNTDPRNVDLKTLEAYQFSEQILKSLKLQ